MTRVLVVSPRPPRGDGHGDQRRAKEIVDALSTEWEVEVLSWLSDVPLVGRPRLGTMRQIGRLGLLFPRMPAQVAYVQSLAPRSLDRRLAGAAAVVFVTNRAVPVRLPEFSVVDFVDDLGALALRRAASASGARRLFWRVEGHRIKRLDRKLAAAAALSVAHSPSDAAGIGPNVRSVPLAIRTSPLPDSGTRVAFYGNLFYGPNHEAAMWICTDLVPALTRLGVGAELVLIAGRRPDEALKAEAARAGVELRADLADLDSVLREAAVVLAPMRYGAGAQYKVLDAVGALRACVVSPTANAGLDLIDGTSALVRDRSPIPFAEAIVSLLESPSERQTLAGTARAQLSMFMPAVVAETWRGIIREVTAGRIVPQANDPGDCPAPTGTFDR